MEVLVVRGRHGGLWGLVVLLALILGACTEEKPPVVKVLRPVRYQAVIITSGERGQLIAELDPKDYTQTLNSPAWR